MKEEQEKSTIQIPGFTAEASLCKPGEQYNIAGTRSVSTEGRVLPQIGSFSCGSLYCCDEYGNCWRNLKSGFHAISFY
jgi:hypothetical protein